MFDSATAQNFKTKIKSNMALRDLPSVDGKIIRQLTRGTKVSIIGKEYIYYKVDINGQIGFVMEDAITITPEMSDFVLAEKEKEKQLELERNKELEEKIKQNLIAEYGEMDGKRIYAKKVWIGMNKNMAMESWGYPTDINKTETAYGISEQWVYDKGNYNYKYLYFENNKLVTIQY